MRRFFKILVLLAPLFPAVASAATDDGQREYLTAAQTFESLKAETLKKGDMPRLSDPRVRETLGILSNRSRSFGSASFPASDNTAVMTLCSVANKVNVGYQLFGLDTFLKEKGFSRPLDPQAVAAAVLELSARNIVQFQDEMYPLLEFSERCFARAMPLLSAFIEKLPPEQMTDIRREGLKKMRMGIKGMATGNILALTCVGVREENHRLMFDAMARDLPVLSTVLPVAERAQLRNAIEKLRLSAPSTYQSKIDVMLKTLNDTSCVGLCRF